jgi:acyl-coenzyme A thioesterase PaaI-like protein
MLGFIDVALFGGARALGVLGSQRVVTLDLSTQFIGATRLGVPLEARVELLRETGHLIFLRGLVVQEEAIVASFTGTVRKLGER